MKPLKSIDAETLLSTPLKPVRFIVDGLIPQGLHLFCGSPKIGKSWLMLWLCLAVAKGEPLWGMHTCKCGVLYLCLEDTVSRIQRRLFQITDEAPETLRFAVAAQQVHTGLDAQIGAYIKQYPDTGLVVIDTLQRIRGVNPDNNAYANDYRDIAAMKDIADTQGIALIIVHHLRKLPDGDPFLKVSGTTGLTGAVDSVFVLEKDKRASDTATLFLSGRDIDYQEITLRFKDCIWQFLSIEKTEDVIKRETPEFLFRLVDFMNVHPTWLGSATELLDVLDDVHTPSNTVTKLLNQYHETVLADNRIIYAYSRTGSGRVIQLTKNDSSDSYDSSLPAEKKPSQLSPTVMADSAERGAGVSLATHLACKV